MKSSFLQFVELVRKTKFTDQEIRKNFNKMVEKGDYARADKNEILRWLLRVKK